MSDRSLTSITYGVKDEWEVSIEIYPEQADVGVSITYEEDDVPGAEEKRMNFPLSPRCARALAFLLMYASEEAKRWSEQEE